MPPDPPENAAWRLPEWRCAEPDCREPTVVAYICDDGHVEAHRDLDHWSDGHPRQPNHHNNWYPLVIDKEALDAE